MRLRPYKYQFSYIINTQIIYSNPTTQFQVSGFLKNNHRPLGFQSPQIMKVIENNKGKYRGVSVKHLSFQPLTLFANTSILDF